MGISWSKKSILAFNSFDFVVHTTSSERFGHRVSVYCIIYDVWVMELILVGKYAPSALRNSRYTSGCTFTVMGQQIDEKQQQNVEQQWSRVENWSGHFSKTVSINFTSLKFTTTREIEKRLMCWRCAHELNCLIPSWLQYSHGMTKTLQSNFYSFFFVSKTDFFFFFT